MSVEEKETSIYTAFDEYVPYDPASPEKNLLRAVLLAAVSDLRKNGEARRQALNYFLSKEEDYIFSFNAICDFLNVDPKKILTVTGVLNNLSGAPTESPNTADNDQTIG
ncbi:MAG: hypothetical protein QY326_07935 [Bdellovibrionota bacterium]|nr:MAG: hypothetical protein QY326_07935 [Bdellovibrionota bacterium]